MKRTAIVIGSGVAGLSVAARLAKKGFDVSVFETNENPGGKLSEKIIKGYRFDLGPSLFTMPNLIDDLMSFCGKDPKDYLKYKRLDVICNYFFDDETTLTAYSNEQKFANEWEEKFGIESKKIISFLNQSRKIYTLTHSIFMEKSLHKISSFLNFQTLKVILNINSLKLFSSMNYVNEKSFKHPKIIQYFNRYATYNGSSPYLAPATLNVIPSLEHHLGAYFPEGGMYSITKALFNLCKDLGVQFHFNKKVSSIIVAKNKVVGVDCCDKKFDAEIVVSNMDVFKTYKNLLPKVKAPEKILNQEKSSSAIIFYWGIKKNFPELDLHNVFFSSNYKREFECLFNEKTIFHDPTIYINISSKYQVSDAPANSENWFVMVNAPNNTNQNWEDIINETKKNCIKKINRILKTNIEELIEVEETLDPVLIEQRTSSIGGSLYGNASNNKFAAFFRHKNFSSQINNLYFCGGSVHPGGGIPLCVLSGKIVSDIIK
jgi:phytoene desaturase